MLEEQRHCAEIVTQLAAASRALDRAGFSLLASGMRQCLTATAEGRAEPTSAAEMDKLFLSLTSESPVTNDGAEPTRVVYWRPGCPYCLTLFARLRLRRIPFGTVNICRDEGAAILVRSHNGGAELVPTVQIGSTFLSNPGVAAVRLALRG